MGSMKHLSTKERRNRIQAFEKGYLVITKTLKEIPEEIWNYKPDEKSWSIHQIIVHLADSEAHAYTRLRTMIAENGSEVAAYNQDLWANELDYPNQSFHHALELFRLLRKLSTDVLMNLSEEKFSRFAVHSEHGQMNVDDWLISYDDHAQSHASQLLRNYEHWKKHKA